MPLQLRRMRRFDNCPFYLYDVGVNKFMGFAIDEKYLHALREVLPDTQIYLDEPMARHTTFHIGGNADVFVLPSSIEALVRILALSKSFSVPVTILGNGSNVLVQDGGIRGTVISFGKPFSRIERNGRILKLKRERLWGRFHFLLQAIPCKVWNLPLEFPEVSGERFI